MTVFVFRGYSRIREFNALQEEDGLLVGHFGAERLRSTVEYKEGLDVDFLTSVSGFSFKPNNAGWSHFNTDIIC